MRPWQRILPNQENFANLAESFSLHADEVEARARPFGLPDEAVLTWRIGVIGKLSRPASENVVYRNPHARGARKRKGDRRKCIERIGIAR